jgi:hypothetical protein
MSLNSITPPAERLKFFLEEIGKLKWDTQNPDTFNQVFGGLNRFIYGAVGYYRKIASKHSKESWNTRVYAWFFGSLGLLAPLIGNMDPSVKIITEMGYPLLGISAASLAYNKLLGSTRGHVRYVKAHLDLEAAIAKAQIDWSEWLNVNAAAELTPATSKEAFDLLRKYLQAAVEIIRQETTEWSLAIAEDMDTVAKQLTAQQKREAPTK